MVESKALLNKICGNIGVTSVSYVHKNIKSIENLNEALEILNFSIE